MRARDIDAFGMRGNVSIAMVCPAGLEVVFSRFLVPTHNGYQLLLHQNE
jgi:hypothetical protein